MPILVPLIAAPACSTCEDTALHPILLVIGPTCDHWAHCYQLYQKWLIGILRCMRQTADSMLLVPIMHLG
jgi:hypothetical protein